MSRRLAPFRLFAHNFEVYDSIQAFYGHTQ